MRGAPEYGLLSDRAAMAFHRGNHRQAADLYAKSFSKTPSHWCIYRYHILHGLMSVLEERYFEAADKDLEFLQKVMEDKHEPKLYRCDAARCLGILNWDRLRREEAAECYRDALRLGEKVTEKERRKKIHAMKDMQLVERQVGEVLTRFYRRHGTISIGSKIPRRHMPLLHPPITCGRTDRPCPPMPDGDRCSLK